MENLTALRCSMRRPIPAIPPAGTFGSTACSQPTRLAFTNSTPRHSPKGAGDLKIDAGSTVSFRYRVIVHAGDASTAKLDEKYKQFAGE